jgi:ABC-2 type transport system permease protein
MLDAVRAEVLKFRRHRATWLMVWIYPVLLGLLIFADLVRDLVWAAESGAGTATAAMWIQQGAMIWSVPLSGGGRFLIAGFAALVFAGEYGWNTWKLIIPARSRWQLLAAKWIATMGLVMLGFAAADLLVLLGSLLRAALGGPGIPTGVTLAAVADAHLAGAAHALLPAAYTIIFAGLFAVLTTSVLATVILSIVLIFLEQLLPAIAIIAFAYAPSLTSTLLQTLPLYHMANVIAWARGDGLTLQLGAGASIASGLWSSLCAVLAWTAIAAAATVARFTRQDQN